MATAVLLKAAAGTRHTPTLLLGVVLPDLAARVPVVVGLAIVNQGIPLPDLVVYGWGVLHVPLGMLAMCFLLCQVFADRRGAFLHLFAGCMLHLALDVFQFHTGSGYPLLFPFSRWHWELGLISTEATVPWSLPLALVAGLAWWARRRSESLLVEDRETHAG
jgi:hypothetical protein